LECRSLHSRLNLFELYEAQRREEDYRRAQHQDHSFRHLSAPLSRPGEPSLAALQLDNPIGFTTCGEGFGLIRLPPLSTGHGPFVFGRLFAFFGLHSRLSINRSNGEGLNRHRDRRIFTIRNLAGSCCFVVLRQSLLANPMPARTPRM
jgi:hypothetical protein